MYKTYIATVLLLL